MCASRPLAICALATALVVGCGKKDESNDQPGGDSDASLSELIVTDVSTGQPLTLEPAFDPEITEYQAWTDGHVVLKVTGKTAAPVFIVVVGGVQADYPSDHEFSQPESLQLSSPAEITVGVTAPDGMSTRVYTIHVANRTSDATLSELRLTNDTQSSAIELEPTFDSAHTDYTAEVIDPATMLSIVGKTNQPNLTVTINGANAETVSEVEFASPPGLDLTIPATIQIEITAADQTTKRTYSIVVSLGGYKLLSAGENHTCAVRGDDTVICWGAGTTYVENCGRGSRENCGQSMPPNGTFIQVAAGTYHTCGLATDGRIACWGLGAHGEYCASGLLCGQATPPNGTFLNVAAGSAHSCAIQTDNIVTCWGGNRMGQSTPPAGQFRQLTARYTNTCGLRMDNSVECWGGERPVIETPDGAFTQISAGTLHACGIRPDSTVTCWGSELWGATNAPAGQFLQVAAGDRHSCGVRTDRTIACWGAGTQPGVCDEGECGQSAAPEGRFLYLSAGASHTCAISVDHAVVCWGGENTLGELDTP